MLKIGLLSDTHAWWDDKYMEYFSECDEIWHAIPDVITRLSGKNCTTPALIFSLPDIRIS